MKYCPAIGGKSPRWLIRQGHYITLDELFGTVKWGRRNGPRYARARIIPREGAIVLEEAMVATPFPMPRILNS